MTITIRGEQQDFDTIDSLCGVSDDHPGKVLLGFVGEKDMLSTDLCELRLDPLDAINLARMLLNGIQVEEAHRAFSANQTKAK